jgi:AraC-like DNA-binding protein
VQRDFELVVLHSGECQVTVNGSVRELKLGQAYLFLPGGREHFQFSADKESHHFWCAVRPRFMPASLRKCLRSTPSCAPCSDLFHSIQTSAFKLRALKSAPARLLIDQLGVCLFAEFLESCRRVGSEGGDVVVQNFLHYVEDHLGDESCLQEARKAAGVSRNTLINKLRAALGTTPGAYLWKLRVERGAAMLAETGHTAAEIAYGCGFKNPFHFSRLLKKHVGQSPRELRRRAWTPESAT